MPMPTEGAWPPAHVAPAYGAYRDWDAWYCGNPDTLRTVYAGRGATGSRVPPSKRSYPGQQAGGIVGRFSRWLWGAPRPASARDGRLHVPLPADLAAVSANLLYSEPPQLTHTDAAVQTFLSRMVEDGLTRKMLHATEANSALGDIYLRPVIDREVHADRAIMSVVHADGAIPTIRWDKLIEVTFWQCVEDDGQNVLRLLEHHDVVQVDGQGRGRITYALFKGTKTDLGQRMPLDYHTETRYLKALTTNLGVQETRLDRLDVIRIPNDGPQRSWRTDGSLKYYGRSDFDGNEQVFDRIDEVYTSWLRDVWAAKARILVPRYMMQKNGPGEGAHFDAEREVFEHLDMLPPQSGANVGITMTSFAIRWQEHKATADALVEVALRHAGVSSQTMGEEGETPITATEAQNRERQSFVTRGKRIQTHQPALAEYLRLHMAVEALNFSGKPEPKLPQVDFGDSVSEAPEVVARTIQLLSAAGAISTEMMVRRANPDRGDTWVKEEVDRITTEKREAMTVTDPGAELGPPNGPPGNPPEDADTQE